jgi:pyrimidine-nucleoside phosphorylase
MSGRGLGHTGGTIDKLESIPNFNTHISIDNFVKQVKEIGVAIVGQMGNLVPADKKIYALRDVTGTVESIPLIASSIMSKKLASGADKILIDLKVGNGALMKTMTEAKELARRMVNIGHSKDKETRCVITNMDQPLGRNIGNTLEVMESIEVLKGERKEDLYDLVIELASQMVSMGKNISVEDAKKEVINNIDNGAAYNKFLEMVKYQEGNIDNLTLAPKIFSIKSVKSGYINHISALKLGEIVRNIGGGRMTKEDNIDYGVGIILTKKIGDHVDKDEELLKIYLNKKDIAIRDILESFIIEDTKIELEPLIYDIIV